MKEPNCVKRRITAAFIFGISNEILSEKITLTNIRIDTNRLYQRRIQLDIIEPDILSTYAS